MAYIPSLDKLQIGVEAVLHDGAADTIEPVGITNFRITPKVESEQIPDKRGDTMPAHLAMVKKRWSEGVIDGYVDYEGFNHFLDGMFGLDATSPHTYIGQLAWAGAAESSLSLRYGQTGALYKVGGVLPKELTVSGSSGEPLKFSYPFFAGAATHTASFQALTADTPDWAKGAHCSISIDAGLGSTIGTTVLADTMFSFNWKVTSNKTPIWHMGDQVWDSYVNGKWGGQLDLVLEATATTLGYIENSLDATATPISYAVRIIATDTANTLQLDFCGTVIDVPNLKTDLDGVQTVELSLMPQYNTVYGSCCGANLIIA